MNPIFNLYKIKYSKLNEILSTDISPVFNKDEPVNVYISLDKLFKELMKKPIDELVRGERSDTKIFDPISNILNLAAHYRNFFTKNGLYSRIVLFGSIPNNYDKLVNKITHKEYRKGLTSSFCSPEHLHIKNLLCECIPFAKTICEYIEDVYLVTTDEIEPSLIPEILKNSLDDGINILVTKDPYEYQYVNKGFTILRPKKEKSYMINKANLLNVLKEEHSCLNSKTVDSSFYSFMLAILGDKFRNIYKVKKIGLSSLINTICVAQDNALIGKENVSFSFLANIINSEYIHSVNDNYTIIDIDIQVRRTVGARSFDIINQLVNKFDNISLRLINDKYFNQYPIYLLELTEAVHNKRAKDIKKSNKNLFTI